MPCDSYACCPTTRQVHWLLTSKVNKKGVVTADYQNLAGVGPKIGLTHRVVTDGVHDLADLEIIEETYSSGGGTHWLALYVPCTCPPKEIFSDSDLGFISPSVWEARTSVRAGSSIVPLGTEHDPFTTVTLMRRMLRGAQAEVQGLGMERSVHSQKTTPSDPLRAKQQRLSTVWLAKFYFPGLCRKFKLGLFLSADTTNDATKLAAQLNSWKRDGVSLEMMQTMMDEFASHPELCRKTREPWKLFVARRYQLAEAITVRQQRGQAGNRDPEAWGKIMMPKRNAPTTP